jgi:iron complex transport system ATP-binding protein
LLTVIGGKYAMIDYWGRVKRSDKLEAAAILERVECSELADRPWGYLSQGERQRVFIGRALMAHPKLLILDEPCAGLDPAAREQFLDFLQRIARQPDAPTLVLVTHHVEEILPLFTHVLGLRDGKVLGAGPLRPTLTSKFLEQIFRAPCRLTRRSGRYQLAIRTRKGLVA